MRILYFNWVPSRAFSCDGGGVSVYQRNLLSYFATQKGAEIYYLTTSYAYDLFHKQPYIRENNNSIIQGIQEYEILN